MVPHSPPRPPSRTPRGLLALTRLWLSGATGMVRGDSAPNGVPICRGGAVCASDLPRLRRLAQGDWIQYDHYPVHGGADRAGVARIIRETAVDTLPAPAPTHGLVRVQPLAPLHPLQELGLSVIRREEGAVVVAPGSLVSALDHLRLLRIETWATPPMWTPDAADEPTETGAPPAPAAPALPDNDELNIEDLASVLAQGVASASQDHAAIAEATQLLDTGKPAEAEALLMQLHARRFDSPEVLYLLVEARARNLTKTSPAGIVALKNSFQLADSFGGAPVARSRAVAALRSLRPSS